MDGWDEKEGEERKRWREGGMEGVERRKGGMIYTPGRISETKNLTVGKVDTKGMKGEEEGKRNVKEGSEGEEKEK